MIKVIPAVREHCAQLAPILRDIDKQELRASMPIFSTEQQLKVCFNLSDTTYSVVDDELGCIAMFGIRDYGESTGIPWMLSSSHFMDNHSRRFVKECGEYLEKLSSPFSFLFNYISVENHVCIRWLTWLGFTVHKDKKYMVGEHPFYLFTKEVNHV